MCVQPATLSIQASRRLWIPQVVWINSAENTGSQATPDLVTVGNKKRRASCSAFFYACLLLLSAATCYAEESDCQVKAFDERVEVRYTVDGDTLHLKDGRKIRLIGINTPEIGHQGKPSQAYAKQARQQLQRLIPKHTRIGLVHDAEASDRYGRTLAHAFLPDGTNLQAHQLAQGLASALPIPPNLKFVACYQKQESLARSKQLGIWTLAGYQTINVDKSDKLPPGFGRISGTVSRISHSKSSVWINFQRPFAIRIERADLDYFVGLDLTSLIGRMLVAQGWVYHRNGQARMKLRHPSQLTIQANETVHHDRNP